MFDVGLKEFRCTVCVHGIVAKHEWKYISCGCGTCGLKLRKSGSSLICSRCSNGEPIGVVKYRVELIVSDTSGKTIFVLLDEDTTKLINMTATELLDFQVTLL